LWGNRPNDKNFLRDWIGVGRCAAEYLVRKKIKMVGIDTLSIDCFETSEFPAHVTFLGNRIPIIENLKNLDLMSQRSYFMALPLPIKEGSASPIRAIGLRDLRDG
jgi:kynurenine formamidase